jgi:hypothetical protein
MDYEARHLIEALRSGVPSLRVGAYFTSARLDLINSIKEDLSEVSSGISKGRVLTGKYGEGKTHMLNTIFSLAQEQGFVVSLVSISKETPPNNLTVLYRRILENTYLPQRNESGIFSLFESLTPEGEKANELYLYALKKLSSDKLYFIFKTLLYSQGHKDDDADALDADLRGYFMNLSLLKKLYMKYCNEKLVMRERFVQKKHAFDYVSFMAKLFRTMGYKGWVILFDEAELIGRMARKSRENAYLNINKFLDPISSLESVYSVFAFSSSFADEVIAGKNEYSSVALCGRFQEEIEAMTNTLDRITKGSELESLSEEELNKSITSIVELYKRAYDRELPCDVPTLVAVASKAGFLLRTKIRAVIEALDQIYQYGNMGEIEAAKPQCEDISEVLNSLFDIGEDD